MFKNVYNELYTISAKCIAMLSVLRWESRLLYISKYLEKQFHDFLSGFFRIQRLLCERCWDWIFSEKISKIVFKQVVHFTNNMTEVLKIGGEEIGGPRGRYWGARRKRRSPASRPHPGLRWPTRQTSGRFALSRGAPKGFKRRRLRFWSAFLKEDTFVDIERSTHFFDCEDVCVKRLVADAYRNLKSLHEPMKSSVLPFWLLFGFLIPSFSALNGQNACENNRLCPVLANP